MSFIVRAESCVPLTCDISERPGQRLIAALVACLAVNLHNQVPSTGTTIAPIFLERMQRQGIKGYVEGSQLKRNQNETTCAGCLCLLGPTPTFPALLCAQSLTCMGCINASSLSTFCLNLSWAQQGPGSRGREVGVLVPATPSPQDHGLVGLNLLLPSLDSDTCPFPLAQSPAGSTTLLSPPRLLHSPLLVSLTLLTPLAVPFVKLSSNYLL